MSQITFHLKRICSSKGGIQLLRGQDEEGREGGEGVGQKMSVLVMDVSIETSIS